MDTIYYAGNVVYETVFGKTFDPVELKRLCAKG
jgi:hypothetical protein